MNIRMPASFKIHVWPGFTDIAISMLLIFLFFVFIQFISTNKALQHIKLQERQAAMEEEFKKHFNTEIGNGEISIKRDGNLQLFTFSDHILFESGEAELEERGRNLLGKVCRLLMAKVPENEKSENLFQSIQINGHTDDIPLRKNGKFPSNWELSAQRAIAVVRLFDQLSGENSRLVSLLSATGFSKNVPIKVEGKLSRDKSRRIEILLLYSEDIK